MELRARIRPFARRAAITAALGVFLVPVAAGPATADAAKRSKKKRYPVVTSVRPMDVAIGETIEIRGKNFRRGKNKNTVVFKRDGARAVFVKAPVGTAKLLRLQVPASLSEFFAIQAGAPVATRFRVRILASRFGRSFTSVNRSPIVNPPRPPATVPPVAAPDGDCDGDGQLNGADVDDDNDLLDDATERSLSLDPCKPDTDGDGVADRFEFDCDRDGTLNRDESDDDGDLLSDTHESSIGLDPCIADSDVDGVTDGYEYQSARDLNDDEYQDPNSWLPYPAKRPYPNALFADADVDHDGDALTLRDEFRLWQTYGNKSSLDSLVYSAGEAFSLSARENGTGRRRPTQAAAGYGKHQEFLNWASGIGYNPVVLSVDAPWHDPANQVPFSLKDFNRSGAVDSALPFVSGFVGYMRNESLYYDLDRDGYLSDDERDEDADGLTNFDESTGRMTSAYWDACYGGEAPYGVKYAGTDLTDADSDGDGVRDGADDQDHDDIPNVMELSRNAASGFADWDTYKGLCVLDDDLLDADGTDADDDPDAPKVIHPTSFGRVNPYNPCLPFTWSRTCDRHPGINGGAAPFDGSTNWASLQ